MFKCPVCGNRHSVPNNYDNKDYICQNSSNRVTPKTFQNMIPTDLLTRNAFNMNTTNTKVDERRAVTVKVVGPGFRKDGSRIDSRNRNW